MQKESYNFETKRKYHEELRRFILGTYPDLKHKDRTRRKRVADRLKIICFPGREGLEILNVYDPLGIPRRNILGVERDAKTADAFEHSVAGRGVQIYRGDIGDYVETTQDHFDIVNLDFQGNLGDNEIKTLFMLPVRGVIKDKAIVGTNFLGKREQDASYYKRVLMGEKLSVGRVSQIVKGFGIGNEEQVTEVIQAELDEAERAISSRTLEEQRDHALTKKVIELFMNGKGYTRSPDFLLTFVGNYIQNGDDPETVGKLRKWIGREYAAQTIDEFRRNRYDPMYEETWVNITARLIGQMHAFIAEQPWAAKISQDSKERIAAMYFNLILSKYADPHPPVRIQRGRYISDTGSPMLYDFFEVRRFSSVIPQVPASIECDMSWDSSSPVLQTRVAGYPYIKMPRTAREIADFNRVLDQAWHLFNFFGQYAPLPERKFLGSSFQPRRRSARKEASLETITREEALTLLDGTCTPQEILSCYTGFSLEELTALEREREREFVQAEEQISSPETPITQGTGSYDITSKEELYAALGLLQGKGKIRATDVRAQFTVSPKIDRSLPAYIAQLSMPGSRKKVIA